MASARALIAAWTLLTIVPLPGRLTGALRPDDWPRGAGAFPLVGAVLGLATALVAWVAIDLLGPYPGATVAVIASALFTGGLHLDGLADLADSLGARGSGEAQRRRRLEILRDSATGAYGTLALAATLILQTTTIAALTLAGTEGAVIALVLAGVLARTAGVLHTVLLRPARAGGLGAAFEVSGRGLLVAAASAAALVGVTCAVWSADQRTISSAMECAAALGGAALALLLTTVVAHRTLDGRTGDTIGATIALAETLALVGFLAAR